MREQLIDEIMVSASLGAALEEKHGIRFQVFEARFEADTLIHWSVAASSDGSSRADALRALETDMLAIEKELRPFVTRIAKWEKEISDQSERFCAELDAIAKGLGVDERSRSKK